MKLIPFKTFAIAVLLFSSHLSFAQENFNLDLLANQDFDELVADVWGFVGEDETEYAIIGLFNGTSILSLEDPSNPTEIAFIPGANSIWRDMHNWDGHVYTVADRGADGLLIVDMANAPDSISWTFWQPLIEIGGSTRFLERCHNIWIDEKGYAYLSGCNLNSGGVIIIDLATDPKNPTFVGAANNVYSHDNYVVNDLLYSADINAGQFSIQDVSDRENPSLLGVQNTTSNFTHNCWLSDDGNYLFTTDERPNAYVDAYDVSDPENIEYISSFRPKTTENLGVIPHNVHYFNGFLVVSWYTDGIVIVDAHRPENMVKVGQYDTFLGGHGGFNGAWGAYPYLPSGLVLGSDRQSGLYVFEPEYVRATYLEGKVTSVMDGRPIPNVDITISSDISNGAETGSNGNYKTGSVSDGLRQVTFSHPQYKDTTIEVELIRGEVVELNVSLFPNGLVKIAGFVVEDNTGETEIEMAKVAIFENDSILSLMNTGPEGSFTFWEKTGTYDLVAGKWGYDQAAFFEIPIEDNSQFKFTLLKGFKDDFILDLGWDVVDTTTNGQWQRVIPLGSELNGDTIHPYGDFEDDLGDWAWVTGNPSNEVPADDFVSESVTAIESQIADLSTYNNPKLNFSYWLFSEDNLENGTFKVIGIGEDKEVEIFSTTQSTGQWIRVENLSLDEVWESGQPKVIKFRIEAENQSDRVHVAGFDAFEITDSTTVNVREIFDPIQWSIFPNPANQFINLVFDDGLELRDKRIAIFNPIGHQVFIQDGTSPSLEIDVSKWSSGTYIIAILDINGRVISQKKVMVSK